MSRVFEVVDATNEELYYTLGVYLNIHEALALLDGKSPPYSDDNPESVKIEVRERRLGFYPHDYRVLASRTWVRLYDDSPEQWYAEPIVGMTGAHGRIMGREHLFDANALQKTLTGYEPAGPCSVYAEKRNDTVS